MGLDRFVKQSSDRHKIYGSHEYDEKLEQIIQKHKDKFPIDLKIEFIEVSSAMTKAHATAYSREGNSKHYIRVSEDFIESSSDERIELTIVHEMVHIYFYQQGYLNHNHDKYFRWVVGRVMGSMTHSTIHEKKWQECIEPFFEMEDN